MKTVKKILKIVFKALLAIVCLVVLFCLIVLWIDDNGTNYLDRSEFSSNDSYLITHANIIPMHKDTVLQNHMLLIKEGRIQKIAKNIEAEGVEVFDAQNQYLLPGLIDMHVHIWDDYELGLYLSNGVTAVRNLWGMPMHLRMKERIRDNEMMAPMFFTSGPKLTGSEFIGDDNLNLHSTEEAREKVISIKEDGYDFIKTYYGLEKELFDVVIDEAIAQNFDIVAHPSQKVPFEYHTHPQIKTIEHTEEIVQQPLQFDLDTLKLQPILDSIAMADHTRYSPTITVFYNIYKMMQESDILASDSLQFINPMIRMVDSEEQFNRWDQAKKQDSTVMDRIKTQHDFHIEIVRRMHKMGIPIVCSTDAGIGVTLPGFSIHQELAFYREAGLSNYEALKTATINVAEVHSFLNDLGSLEVGKWSNLLLVKENPLEDLSALKRPNTIFVKGIPVNRTTLDSFETKAKERENLIASGLRYAEYLFFGR